MSIFILIIVLSIWIFIKTLSYGIYEIKQNSNTFGGVATIVIAVISLVSPILVLYVNGFYQ